MMGTLPVIWQRQTSHQEEEESIENEWVVESLGQTESRFDYSPNNERELCSLSSLSTIWPNT
jgi:hypothetical protein